MISDNELIEFAKGSTALYLNKRNVLVNGKKAKISAVPLKCGDKIMLPAKFFAESIGAEFIADGGKALMKKDGREICITENIGGTYYEDANKLCNTFGKYLHTEDNGIIIYSDTDMSDKLNWRSNLKMMRKLSESYMFDDVSGKEIADKIISKNPDEKHPRIIMTDEKFAEIRAEINNPGGDRIYKLLFERLKTKADKYMNEKTSGYEIRDGIRLLYVCRENKERMMTLALIYNLTLDERYAMRAYMEMYVSACFVDWHPYHFLDVGEMAACMGICYDWLYNWMEPWQRKPIREAIVKNGIYPIIDDFDDKPRNRSWNWRGELADNWCFVIGGVGVGAMAVVDELSGQDRTNAERAMEQTLIDIRRALSLFAPNGGYEEGVIYWGLTMEFFTYYMKALLTSINEDFGYIDVPGMRNTNKFLFAMNGSVSIFNYHDAGRAKTYIPPQSMFLADYFGKYEEAQPRINKILNNGEADVMDICLYEKKFSAETKRKSELNTYMPVAETVTMRTGWNKDDIYVGLHCDDPYGGPGHDHMDAGQFVIDALGENFFMDLGPDSYNLPKYHDTYHFRAEGHNTVVINPSMDYGQKFGGKANIEKYCFSDNGGYAIGNMTNAYDEAVSFRRGIMLNASDKTITLRDEINLKEESEILWSAHTCAEIETYGGGKKARLKLNGKTLYAEIKNSDSAVFNTMAAKPLPTSPMVEGQDENDGIQKLVIALKKCKKIDLTVVFSTEEEKSGSAKPLNEWEI